MAWPIEGPCIFPITPYLRRDLFAAAESRPFSEWRAIRPEHLKLQAGKTSVNAAQLYPKAQAACRARACFQISRGGEIRSRASWTADSLACRPVRAASATIQIQIKARALRPAPLSGNDRCRGTAGPAFNAAVPGGSGFETRDPPQTARAAAPLRASGRNGSQHRSGPRKPHPSGPVYL